jgi:hypothetical protein
MVKHCAAIVALVGIVALAVPAGAQMYLDFAGSPIRSIPADCSEWHELFPNFCTIHHQDAYEDNGDGIVSVCDIIILGGVRYHVDWAGPTYELEDMLTGERVWYEPTDPTFPTNPVCSTWLQVAPDFGWAHHVDGWEDGNGDQVLSECDTVWIGGRPWHVAVVNLDITVTEEPSPVAPASWSAIKHLFGTF